MILKISRENNFNYFLIKLVYMLNVKYIASQL